MATLTITEKHQREMSPERDFPGPTKVQSRYAILSSPRSGSTLLGRVLHETGLAGDPQEYFNPPLLALERKRSGNDKLNINQFLQLMERRRTSPNGVFGIKMHYSQLLGACGTKTPNANVVNFLRKMDKLIWIRRRDRIGQAISQAVAAKTNVWSSEDSRFKRDPDIKVHPFDCVAALTVIAREDTGWEKLLPHAKLTALEVWYEDLVANYDAEFRRVLDYLGLPSATIPKPPLERQAGELNERLRGEMHAYLGVTPGHQ
jgi:LPS sulfotransferase NodH